MALRGAPFSLTMKFIVNIIEGTSKGQNGGNFEVSESFEKRKRK